VRALILGEKEKKAIEELTRYADSHRINKKTLEQMAQGKALPIGDDPHYVCYLPDGFRVVFSFEEQPMGWSRHLSVSVDAQDKCPNPHAVQLIMMEFGFRGSIKDCCVWTEDLGERVAVNLVQGEID